MKAKKDSNTIPIDRLFAFYTAHGRDYGGPDFLIRAQSEMLCRTYREGNAILCNVTRKNIIGLADMWL